MPIPCRADCLNQRDNLCQLDDEQVKNCRVEFGEEWDPVELCRRYLPRQERESTRRRRS